ncbi:unnamed protein product [Bemisia tabaci]|uniref:Ubiquitin carboxyl-terminal hydrolase n=1 Tax=Bemisia tabaci TaxID=7038 RepID=A0A9P0AF92_BEMTA|nr:unnamed protein product [Bemisia tabaci]
MATYTVSCKHSTSVNLIQSDLEKIKRSNRAECSVCGRFPTDQNAYLWVCLHDDCLKTLCCFEDDERLDHGIAHFQANPVHSVHLQMPQSRAWCYLCKSEVSLVTTERKNIKHRVFRNNSYNDLPEDDSDDDVYSSSEDPKPTGLTGLQNIGNTCYMNAALQALSNTPPLTEFFLDFALEVLTAQDPPSTEQATPLLLSRSYHRLIRDIWHKKRPGYVAPTGILFGIRNVHPMFRGYHQHDTQEFLRCFMDQLHEELKVPVSESSIDHKPKSPRKFEVDDDLSGNDGDNEEENPRGFDGASSIASLSSQSDGDEYETCDSGVSERSSLSDETDRRTKPMLQNAEERCRSKSISSRRQNSVTRYRNRNKLVKYRSIISDIFNGKLLSTVQCLTCQRRSDTVETFQDLSLPIPNRDHLTLLHQTSAVGNNSSTLAKCTKLYAMDQQGWFVWFWEWLCSWFWGPTVGLHDCLAAFFSADELKGDNMYSCEKCKKLRNGMKFSKVLELPEVLCIHLKRFRHEIMFSSKISSYVNFPLEGLDMRPFLHKDCKDEVTSFDLFSVICHHGNAGSGGHYIAYCLHATSGEWYEFDDQCVTRVSAETVNSCEAYVLFYRKSNARINQLRCQVVDFLKEPFLSSTDLYYISKQWMLRFNTFAEPGPINNSDFLCSHGSLIPSKEQYLNQLAEPIPKSLWDFFHSNFGGGPVCKVKHLNVCPYEQNIALLQRAKLEYKNFSRLKPLPVSAGGECLSQPLFAVSASWFKQWEQFVRGEVLTPPGPIDNSPLVSSGPQNNHREDSFCPLSREQWNYLENIYGGGPEIEILLQGQHSLRDSCIKSVRSLDFEPHTFTNQCECIKLNVNAANEFELKKFDESETDFDPL